MYYHSNIERDTINNTNYRKVVWTTSDMQLVLMNLAPGVEIGLETHTNTTQFFRVESGVGIIQVGDDTIGVTDGDSVIVEHNTPHNVKNISNALDLKIYTIYSKPEHVHDLVEAKKTYRKHN